MPVTYNTVDKSHPSDVPLAKIKATVPAYALRISPPRLEGGIPQAHARVRKPDGSFYTIDCRHHSLKLKNGFTWAKWPKE